MQVPLDATRSSHLGAQAQVGRWLRDDVASRAIVAAQGEAARPALTPISRLAVRNMAVMAA
jgi:hypothetical protein